MIEQISFYEYVTIGPQSEQVRFLNNGQALQEYRMTITFDDDPRFLRLSCARPQEDTAFVQLVPITSLCAITIGREEIKRGPGRPPKS